MASDDDMEDYGFEFEYSDDELDYQYAHIENQFYNSKGMVETDPEGALAGFVKVVQMEQQKTKCEKCINSIMDYVSSSPNQNFDLLQEFYQITLKALEEAKNEVSPLDISFIYLVFVNMLIEPTVNPFDGHEAKPFKDDPEIFALKNLIAAYEEDNILEFQKILKSNRKAIMDDPFIRYLIEPLLQNVRTQLLVVLIKPYTRISIPFMSEVLNCPEHDVEKLLVSLILDNTIQGHIDQVNQILELSHRSKGMKMYTAVEKWIMQHKYLYQTISTKFL